jgi:hypothetical protein
LSPVHLRAEAGAAGDIRLRWVRRTRIDGDSWFSPEVPLGEEREEYLVTLTGAGGPFRQVRVTAPEWIYSAADRALDGVSGPVTAAVAQLSVQFGAGPPARTVFAA